MTMTVQTAHYLEGPLGSGKTKALVEQTVSLLSTQPSESFLILCSNPIRQRAFSNRLQTALHQQPLQHGITQPAIYTYAGFVRTTLFNVWPLVEGFIQKSLPAGEAVIQPELVGMEESELMLTHLLDQLRISWPEVFSDFPGADRSIVKQLIRRLRLRSENRLSRTEMSRRSGLIAEICQPEVAELERQFDRLSYTLRMLDPNKQLDVFHHLLSEDNPWRQRLYKRVKMLIVDDIDETTAAQQQFIETLATATQENPETQAKHPVLTHLILAADPEGGSRRGYLNAFPYDWPRLKTLISGETQHFYRHDLAFQCAHQLQENWLSIPEPLPYGFIQCINSLTRTEQMDQVVHKAVELLRQGKTLEQLVIIIPKDDPLTYHQLTQRFHTYGIPLQFVSGSKRPVETPVSYSYLLLIQWLNIPRWKQGLSPFELKAMLMNGLGLSSLMSPFALEALIQEIQQDPLYPQTGELPDIHITEPQSAQRYQQLRTFWERMQTLDGEGAFEKQLYALFFGIIVPFSARTTDRFNDIKRWMESARKHQLLMQRLRQIQPDKGSESVPSTQPPERLWFERMKYGSVADTPDVPIAIETDKLVVASPQKVIDYELYRETQLWLDTSSREWSRTDNAPLYHSWVHSAAWQQHEDPLSEAFNEQMIRVRAAHITRNVTLLATQQILCFDSEFDDAGYTQDGLLKTCLLRELPHPEHLQQQERPTLRPDQLPVLDYTEGKLAISAVPGAGKTFVNVELILTLIERGIAPESILVLTYMDSAAKTLLKRLKNKLSGITSRLPVVSTIHSLAYKLLMDGDHAIALGWQPDDLEILDELGQDDILTQVAQETLPASMNSLGQWATALRRGIGHAKMLNLSPETLADAGEHFPAVLRLQEFLPAYTLYQQTLHRNGQLDFTDLIVQALKLLKTRPDVAKQYQERFHVVIEDEAQDSSQMLQQFLSLLTAHSGNFIRTGDPNQSINTTFSTADPSVFLDFCKEAHQVVTMDHSSRCAPEIITLANNWIEACIQHPELHHAFQPVAMQPVIGQNPTLLETPHCECFETAADELNWITQEIKRLQQEAAPEPPPQIALLLRQNQDASEIAFHLQQSGIAAISLTEQLGVHPVFQLIYSTLRFLFSPFDLNCQAQWLSQLDTTGYLSPDLQNNTELMTLLAETPFLSLHPHQLLSPADPEQRLLNLYYNLLEWQQLASGPNISGLVAIISKRLCQGVIERSNGYLCSLWVQELLREMGTPNTAAESIAESVPHQTLSPLEWVVQHLEKVLRAKRGRKAFSEILAQKLPNLVQVMSLHKSKGQEFDVVFLPRLSEPLFPDRTQSKSIRIEEPDRLIDLLEAVSRWKRNPKEKLMLDTSGLAAARLLKIEEEARLFYVGITRAKRALFLSTHLWGATTYGKAKSVAPAYCFQALQAQLKAENKTTEAPLTVSESEVS